MSCMPQITGKKGKYTMNLVTEKSTVGAFYLHKKPQEELIAAPEDVQDIGMDLRDAFKNIKEKILDFDPKEFAKNFALECPSKFVMKYATAIIVMLSKGKAVKCDEVLDLLFLDMAPLMNMTSLFMGYLSVDAMRHAMKNNLGTFKVVGFLRGMNYALKTIQNEKKIKQFEELYEDIIPIHLIESCQFEYKDNISVHKLKNEQGKEYIAAPGAKEVAIKIIGHIKNVNGNFTLSNDYIHKLETYMAEDKWYNTLNNTKNELNISAGTITLRIGNVIYENCLLNEFDAKVDVKEKDGGGVCDLRITAKLLYNIFDHSTVKNDLTYVNDVPNYI